MIILVSALLRTNHIIILGAADLLFAFHMKHLKPANRGSPPRELEYLQTFQPHKIE
jgi:hypothetical protein